jgi:MoxR-like ATPase
MEATRDHLSVLRARAHEARYENLRELRDAAKDEVRKVVVGQDQAVELLLVAALAHGHVLIEGPPGSAKTLLSRAMAHVLGSSFKRIQFTPDTTPTHIIGQAIMKAGESTFVQGPIFANVVLADEVNRTPPRTQAAMLEAMQERHVTVDGNQHRLPDPFLVIATQNPFEHEGIFPLPESQLDRFLFKIDLDYCDPQSEVEMLTLPHLGIAPDMLGEIRPLLGVAGLDKARTEIDTTVTPEPVLRYIVGLVRATREQSGVELGASSRAAIHLLAATKAQARISGRDTITSSDVQFVAPYVLRHRLIVSGTTPQAVLREVLQAVPAP